MCANYSYLKLKKRFPKFFFNFFFKKIFFPNFVFSKFFLKKKLLFFRKFFLILLFKNYFWPNFFVVAEIDLTSWVNCILVLFCLKLGHHKGTKVTESDFWKKIMGSHMGKKHFLGIFDVFCQYFCTQSSKFSEISYT